MLGRHLRDTSVIIMAILRDDGIFPGCNPQRIPGFSWGSGSVGHTGLQLRV